MSCDPEVSAYNRQREQMVRRHIQGRGVRDVRLLDALRCVRREAFVPRDLATHAYEDAPLPIGEGQTISQPYIVAFMVEALDLKGGEKVLEIGAGSGYAAAVLGEMAREIYAIERLEALASAAARRLDAEGYRNVHVRYADGTEGWADMAPFDAILVSAGAPTVPESLKAQLAVGGRMVIPVGHDKRAQVLVRLTRQSETRFDREELADVRFVPLIGEQGWEVEPEGPEPSRARVAPAVPRVSETLPALIERTSEAFEDVEHAQLDPMIDRIGNAQVVLIGEATHGTSEFYRMRAAITRRLIAERGFTIVAAEADWPDAARIDHYVRHKEASASEWTAFARFPTWMWRNAEVRAFVDWLHSYNAELADEAKVGFFGLDLYSLHSSARAVIDYLEDVDPQLADVARWRYGCLSPWEADPAAYGHAALTGRYRDCERQVVAMLKDLHERRQVFVARDGERYFDAAQNAELVANAERYYRVMYYGSRASWNLRDTHMFDTLERLLAAHGRDARAVVWAHNSHIGDAAATEMAARGEINLGQLCRERFSERACRIGFGTDHGTVAAASEWDGPMENKNLRPCHPRSYERVFHRTERPGLVLSLSRNANLEVVGELAEPRLQRAIGVIYRPDSELASHYFEAELPAQFDEYIWIDETTAITPLSTQELEGLPDTYPFGV